MNSRNISRVVMNLALVSALAASFCTGAMAQRAPDPPAWPPPEEPRQSPVPEEFLAQYKAAGSPTVLIFTYLISTSEKSEAEAISDTGIAHRLNSLIVGQFIHPELSVRGLDAGNLRAKDDFKAVVRRDQSQAARIIGRETDADLVFYVFLTEDVTRTDGTRYAASYNVLDRNRNEIIGSTAWDLKPDRPGEDLDARRLRKYAEAIAKRVRDDIRIYHPSKGGAGSARRYELNMRGVPDKLMTAFRDRVATVKGVQEIRRSRFDDRYGASVTIVDLSYVGDVFDLTVNLKAAASDVLDMDARVVSAGEGRIDLWARQNSAEMLMADPNLDAAETRKLRQRFATAYAKKASPTIAVMINKEASPDEVKSAQGVEPGEATSQPAGTQIIVRPEIYVNSKRDPAGDLAHGSSGEAGPGEKDGKGRLEDTAVDTKAMENYMAERFLSMKVRVKNLEQAKRMLAKDRNFQRDVWRDVELAQLLGEREGADIVISGVGRVSRERGRGKIQYTFSAFSVHNADVLAACNVAFDTYADGAVDINNISQTLADEAVGRLAYGMMIQWEPPTRFEVRVSNVASPTDVQAVADLLKAKIAGVETSVHRSFTTGPQGGIGYIDITYTMEYEDLLTSIRERQDRLPFQLDAVTGNREVLNLKLVDKP
jgi:hypothetical protein